MFSCSSDSSDNVDVVVNPNVQATSFDDTSFGFKEKYVYLSNITSLSDSKKKEVTYEDIDIQLYSVIQTDKELPIDLETEKDWLNYLSKSEQKFIIHYFINDILNVSQYYIGDKVVNSIENEEFLPRFRAQDYPRSNECSAEGVRQCANKHVYSAGLVSKISCAFAFYACYANYVGDCLVSNCTGLDKKEKLEYYEPKYPIKFIEQKLVVLEEYSLLPVGEFTNAIEFKGGYRFK